MSAAAAVRSYDAVFDGQRHYRALLQATARPGTIARLDGALQDALPPLNRASALVVLALFSGDISYHLDQAEASSVEFIEGETSARRAGAEDADFVILPDASRLDSMAVARTGTLAYPDLGATAIVQVAAISPAPVPGALRLRLTGPGVEREVVVFVLGAGEQFFALRRELNAEFPVGVDLFLTCDSLSAGPCVLAVPRTTQVEWERVP